MKNSRSPYLFLVKFFVDVDFPCIIPKLLSLLLATRFSVPFFSSMISGALKRESVSHFSCVWLFATLWTAAHQASLSFTISQSLLKLMSIELVMPSNISFSAIPFSSCPPVFPESGSFPMKQKGKQWIKVLLPSQLPLQVTGAWLHKEYILQVIKGKEASTFIHNYCQPLLRSIPWLFNPLAIWICHN